MKKAAILILLIVSFILSFGGASFAQPTTKIVVVNAVRAFEESAEGKKAIAQFQDRESKIKADLQKLDDALRALQNRLSTGRLTMTQEALMSLQSDIDKSRLHAGQHPRDTALMNASGQRIFVRSLEENLDQLVVFEAG